MTREIVAANDGDRALEETVAAVAGQLAPRSRQTYSYDAQHFAAWLDAAGLSLLTLDRDAFIRYRQHLHDRYAKTTAARMLTVARRICSEAVDRRVLDHNPAERVRGFTGISTETPRTALSHAQARAMLAAIDRTTALGQRDYALLTLLLRTGLRRSEAAALRHTDLTTEQGHHILYVEHGKGDKRRVIKLPVDVQRALDAYMLAAGRTTLPASAPLFVSFRKGDRPMAAALSVKGMEKIVIGRAQAIGVHLTPHSLRASFVTLALEGGAKLQQVQYAVGHADPRTTERYQRRKLNLDDNAVDYVKL